MLSNEGFSFQILKMELEGPGPACHVRSSGRMVMTSSLNAVVLS